MGKQCFREFAHILSPSGQALMIGVSIATLALLATETMISDSSSDMLLSIYQGNTR